MTEYGYFRNLIGNGGQKARRKCGSCLSLRAARFLIFIADDVKLHEVRRAANKQRRPRHDSHDVSALDEFLIEQTLFGDEDELLDVVHLSDRSRHHAPVERKPPPR